MMYRSTWGTTYSVRSRDTISRTRSMRSLTKFSSMMQ